MAIISRAASAEGRNAIMCRLYATIIAKAHGAERRRNRRQDRINRPMVGASACGTCLVFPLFSLLRALPSSLDISPLRLLFFRDPSPKSLLLECPLRHKKGLPLTWDRSLCSSSLTFFGDYTSDFRLLVRTNTYMILEKKIFEIIRSKFCIIWIFLNLNNRWIILQCNEKLEFFKDPGLKNCRTSQTLEHFLVILHLQ